MAATKIYPMRRAAGLVALLASGFVALALPLSVQAAAPPLASTGGFASLTFSSVVLRGGVSPRGSATDFAFQYGLNRSYGAQTPLEAAGGGAQAVRVSTTVTGLRADTLYHYRLVALGAGTGVGRDHTFRTPKIPLSLAIAGVPDPVVFGSPFAVVGNLSGTDGGGRRVVLDVNPFPYLAGFRPLGNPELTSATGGFTFPVLGLLENAQLRVITLDRPVIASPVVSETVAVRVAFHVHRASRRGFVHLYGTVAPAEVGALVGFQLLVPGHRSINEGGTVLRSATASVSSFSRVVRIPRRGLYRAFIKINDGAHISGYSAPVLIR